MLVLWMAGLLACADKAGSCGAEALAAGSAEAGVGGAAWSNDAVTWTWAGSSLQVNSTASEGWLLSLVAQTDLDGQDLETAAAGELPIEVDLMDGGFAVMYPDTGDSYASNKGAGGTLEITAIDDVVQGCFSFEAATAGGEALSVSAGAFHAAAM